MDESATLKTRETRRILYLPGGPFTLLFLLLFVAYPLGFPYALMLSRHYPAMQRPVYTAYAPIGFLFERCPPVERFYNWYTRAWK